MNRPRRQAAASTNYSQFFPGKDEVLSEVDKASSDSRGGSSSEEDTSNSHVQISSDSNPDARACDITQLAENDSDIGTTKKLDTTTSKSRRSQRHSSSVPEGFK